MAGDDSTMAQRVAGLEAAVAAMADVVSTRRLVVLDAAGRPRLVAEVTGATVALTLETAGGGAHGPASVVLHAGDDGDTGLGGLVGLQLWAGGDTVAELDAWPGADGRWRPGLHLEGPA